MVKTFSVFSVLMRMSTSKPITIFSSGLRIFTLTGALLELPELPPVKDEVIELMSSPEEALAVALT